MPVERQVGAVAKKLQELNPGFDGKVTPAIDDGVVLGSINFAAAVPGSCCEDLFEPVEGEGNPLPPVEDFMPKAAGWKYGEILKARCGRLMESETYGSIGEFQ